MKVLYAKRLLALALIVTVTLPAVAQDTKTTSFVDKVAVSDQAVTFHTEGNYVGFTMQVAGPDEFYLQQRFSGDETPVLRVKDKEKRLADGPYTIQIIAQPVLSEKMRKRLERARAENDRATITRAFKEAGLDRTAMIYAASFGVREGRFVDPDAPVMEEGDQTGAVIQTNDHDLVPRVPEVFRTLTPVRLSDTADDMTGSDSGPAGYVAPADVTATTLDRALEPFLGNPDLPDFIANAANPEEWKQAYFQNTVDGKLILFQGYVRPVKGSEDHYLSYFRQADEAGQGFGVWFQGLFLRDGDGFRFLDHVGTQQAAATPQPPLFDYMTEEAAHGQAQHAAQSEEEVMDILHNDDVIIFFSLCVGNDCVNGESFGFDTIRLKENNVRIDFLDTSSTASFPDNDWEITINDSSNGGAEYFAVTDASAGRQVFRLTAGAPANSLFVDSQGDWGQATSTPAVEVDIADGDTPTVRLQQNGSSGFTPQTWDLAGNETNFFVRDVTNGSRLPFRIRPSAGTSSIDINDGLVEINGDAANIDFVARGDLANSTTLFVDADAQGGEGGVGIGTDTPGIDLNITNDNPQLRWTTGNVRLFAAIALAGATEGHFEFRDVSDGNAARIRLRAATSATNPGDVEMPNGDLIVSGNITKGGGGFKIDHPVNPETQYLYHSFVESPERMNVYNGNITLDANGAAVVTLPDYFQALNREFRYQLTAIGAPGPNLYVAREIDGNQFQISGGTAGMRVSWQVTGVRQDPWALQNPMPAVQDKPADLQGFYLHSQAYNQPITRSIEYLNGEQAREDLQKLQAQQQEQR